MVKDWIDITVCIVEETREGKRDGVEHESYCFNIAFALGIHCNHC